jgi:DNA invertase Pin-like site-specific DNA recombinase
MQVWTLLVVSSSSAAQADSLENQQVWTELKAAEKGWTIPSNGVFKEPGTGKNGVRKIVKQLLSTLQKTEAALRPDWILTIRSDRIGRGDPLESLTWIKDITDLGVRIWTRYPDEEVEIASLGGFLKSSMFAALARSENEVKREKMVAKFEQRRRDGIPTNNLMPYGLRFVKNSQPRIMEDQAETVREIFKMRADGYGVEAIALHIGPIAAPARYADGTDRVKPSKWNRTKVQEILDRDIYCPIIVDEVTFARARKVGIDKSQPYPTKKYFYALSGMIRCFCGDGMVGIPTGTYRTYRCRNKLFHSKRICIGAEKLESQFVALLHELAANEDLTANFKERANTEFDFAPKLKEASAELESINKKQKRLVDLYAGGEIEKSYLQASLDGFAEDKGRLERLISDLRMRIVLEQHSAVYKADVQALLERSAATYIDASPDDQRMMVKHVHGHVDGLYVDAERNLQPGNLAQPSLVSDG